MLGRILKVALAAALVVPLALPAAAKDLDRKRSDDVGALIVGGIIFGAAAAAASSSVHRHQNQYRPDRRYRPGAPFSPAAGVTCYPREMACYKQNGDFAPGWTRRVF